MCVCLCVCMCVRMCVLTRCQLACGAASCPNQVTLCPSNQSEFVLKQQAHRDPTQLIYPQQELS